MPVLRIARPFTLPYDYLDSPALEHKVRTTYEWFKVYLKKAGMKKDA